jgi:hypothetical protein
MRQDETEEAAAINHFMDRKITTLFTSSRVLSDNDSLHANRSKIGNYL